MGLPVRAEFNARSGGCGRHRLSLEDPRALWLDLPGSKALEHAAALAEDRLAGRAGALLAEPFSAMAVSTVSFSVGGVTITFLPQCQ